jgi:hypothetical protein
MVASTEVASMLEMVSEGGWPGNGGGGGEGDGLRGRGGRGGRLHQ